MEKQHHPLDSSEQFHSHKEILELLNKTYNLIHNKIYTPYWFVTEKEFDTEINNSKAICK